MNNKTGNTFHRGHTSSFYSKCCNLQITDYRMLQKNVTDIKLLQELYVSLLSIAALIFANKIYL
jgi:hypothetical protein